VSVPVVLAFAAVILSFLSPCIIPMISLYLTLVTGTTLEGLKEKSAGWRRSAIMVNTLLLVLGFALVFTAAGGAAGAVESLFEQARRPLEIVGGVLIVMLGLSMAGLLRLRLAGRFHIPANRMRHRPRGPLGSFAVGLFLAVACSHCIAPTLLSVMAVAGTTGSPEAGALTMLIFSLGLALPYLATAVAIGPVLELSGSVEGGDGLGAAGDRHRLGGVRASDDRRAADASHFTCSLPVLYTWPLRSAASSTYPYRPRGYPYGSTIRSMLPPRRTFRVRRSGWTTEEPWEVLK